MNKFLPATVIVVLLISIFFFITCKKEFSYEGGGMPLSNGGTSVYTFVVADGTCSNSILSGNYYIGVALNTTNTIQLQVSVDSVGTYIVNTSAANGIYFTGSGTFTNTGIQNIILTGTGTPTASGNFKYTTPGSTSCAFTVAVTKPPEPKAAFTLLGAPDACSSYAVSGDYVVGNNLTAGDLIRIEVNVTAIGPYSVSTDTLDGISFSGNGTFANLGDETLTLYASGKPETPDNLSFKPLVNVASCSFNVAVTNPEPLAEYVLESGFGNSSPCICTIAGSYSVNTALSSANSVSIRVDVLKPGNYTISTATVNGVKFSYTGVFANADTEDVILKGSGTPQAAGTFAYVPMIVGPAPYGGAACGFTIKVE